MEKIPTIFDRDWEGNKGVVNRTKVANPIPEGAIATEKIDGTNVRVTVRNHTVVRVEKRRNPDKIQKHKGIEEPWYIDASDSAEDKWIMDAVKNTDLTNIYDGEWSGEAVGTNIQGNPLNLDKNIVVFFSLMQCPIFTDCPRKAETLFEDLKEWLPRQKSKYGKDCGIEGIVWWLGGEPIGKIKIKDFK